MKRILVRFAWLSAIMMLSCGSNNVIKNQDHDDEELSELLARPCRNAGDNYGNGWVCSRYSAYRGGYTHQSCASQCRWACGAYGAGKYFRLALPGGKVAAAVCVANFVTNQRLCNGACWVPGYRECLKWVRRNNC